MKIPNSFVFMKVGKHAKESLDVILERKQRELDKTGRIFWGYGGATCHPTKQVQPFIRSKLAGGVNEIFLLMEPINSLADPQIEPAREYSVDNVNWEPIPKGIIVTGSKYALVLDEITPTTLTVDPRRYVVGIGDSMGKHAIDYLRGRVDKGCFHKAEVPGAHPVSKHHAIGLVARMKDPYAVFVRG
jgi:hypothetical protein